MGRGGLPGPPFSFAEISMKIRMTTGLSGPEYSLGPGDERDFPKAEALRLIDAGFAVPVADDKPERAARNPAVEKRG